MPINLTDRAFLVNAGTITAAGDTVTGSGTAFLLAGVSPGDLLVTGARVVAISEVPSDASLKTQPAIGTVAAGSAYAIIRHPGDSSELSALARELLSRFGDALVATAITFRGEWSSSASYVQSDHVTVDGSSYLAKRASLNAPPAFSAADWQLMALRGATLELQVTATHIQWRPVGSAAWSNLIDLSALIGAQGPSGAGYGGTSTTSLAITNSASRTFVTQSGLAYQAGARIRAAEAGGSWMEGVVTSYSGTSLVVTMDDSSGTGTFANWTINIAGQRGAPGAGTGDVVGPASAVANRIARFNGTTGKLIADGGTDLALVSGVMGAAEASLASSATTDIGAQTSINVLITGTTTITSLGTTANAFRILRFAGALTLTHNATSLILSPAANITTAAGDIAVFRSDASGNWRLLDYQKADGTPLVGGGGGGNADILLSQVLI